MTASLVNRRNKNKLCPSSRAVRKENDKWRTWGNPIWKRAGRIAVVIDTTWSKGLRPSKFDGKRTTGRAPSWRHARVEGKENIKEKQKRRRRRRRREAKLISHVHACTEKVRSWTRFSEAKAKMFREPSFLISPFLHPSAFQPQLFLGLRKNRREQVDKSEQNSALPKITDTMRCYAMLKAAFEEDKYNYYRLRYCCPSSM